MRWGIKAIIGESYAEIFYSNCLAIGIPCFTQEKRVIKKIQEEAKKNILSFEIDIAENKAVSNKLEVDLLIKESSKKMFLSGDWDATSILLNNSLLIDSKINELPYVNFNPNNL